MFQKRPSLPALTIIFGAVEDGALYAFGMVLMRQTLPTAVRLFRLSRSEKPVSDMFKYTFIYYNHRFTYINAGSYIRLLVSKASTDTQ